MEWRVGCGETEGISGELVGVLWRNQGSVVGEWNESWGLEGVLWETGVSVVGDWRECCWRLEGVLWGFGRSALGE